MTEESLVEACRRAEEPFPAIQEALGTLVGHRLFTLMAIDWASEEAARIYTSHPAEYPVGGRKPLGTLTDWGRVVLEGQQPWIGNTAEDIRGAFFDYELIFSLGCEACMNVPVIDNAGAGETRVIGTINLLHKAGHFHREHVTLTEPFAALLLQPFRDWALAGGGQNG